MTTIIAKITPVFDQGYIVSLLTGDFESNLCIKIPLSFLEDKDINENAFRLKFNIKDVIDERCIYKDEHHYFSAKKILQYIKEHHPINEFNHKLIINV
jgi:uncharacterized protein YifN (PemK superfamily)